MRPTDQEIINAAKSNATMSRAATSLKIHFNTFRGRAQKLGVYNPNQGGKGTSKKHNGNKIPLKEILEGKHPYYQTGKLRARIIKEGIMDRRCSVCNLEEWNNKEIPIELDHIDGDRTNHKLENVRLVCPNCHAQTSTYRGKNGNYK